MNTDIFKFTKKVPEMLVVDNFFDDPDAVREFALQQEFTPHPKQHKGQRTHSRFSNPETKAEFERLLGVPIRNNGWNKYGANGVFQFCTCKDPLVWHSDSQDMAAVVYLTPDAPPESGTSLYRSKITGLRYPAKGIPNAVELNDAMFSGNLLDKTKWELIDTIGNVYNRLVIWNGKAIHAASNYFGTRLDNSRLFQIFFFDIEK
jgi:hypothetical protein